MKIPIEISARHVHLSEKDMKKIFGKEHEMKLLKDLSQGGNFASKDTVDLINRKNKIENVRVLGKTRKESQCEISLTDAYKLKLNPLPEIRLSGNLKGTTKITIQGKKGKIKIPVIIAKRHLHANPKEAKKLGIKNNQNISIKTKGRRSLIFNEIKTRVKEHYKLALHLDTDEGNAAGIKGKAFGEIVK